MMSCTNALSSLRHWSLLSFLGVLGAAAAIETMLVLPKKHDYLVDGLSRIEPAFGAFAGKMYAGLVPFQSSSNRQGHYMFWLFVPTSPTVMDSLVLWLNGGPGCSSFNGGVSFENSPVTVPSRPAGDCCSSPLDPFVANPYSWTNAAPMLYVEQPGGVGFSDGPQPENEGDISDDMFGFLQSFYQIFEEYQTTKLFLFGESYAGMFVPSIAHGIHLKNKSPRASQIHIPLAGIALGNGWMDAVIQGPTVIDFAWWHGMIDENTKLMLHDEWKKCATGEIGNNPDAPYFHELTIPDECGIMEAVLRATGKGLLNGLDPNTYDITTWDTYPSIDSDQDTTLQRFYNNPRVKEALHAPAEVYWRGCIPGAGRRNRHLQAKLLDQDRPKSMISYLESLLDEAGIRILVYNGDRDLSTNAPGTERVLNSMKGWSGHKDWISSAPRGLWLSEGKMAGWAKEFNKLSYLVVYNSGHLLPYNQPARSLELAERFLRNSSFMDKEIPPLNFASTKEDMFNIAPIEKDTVLGTPKMNLNRVEDAKRSTITNELIAVGFLVIFVGGIFALVLRTRRQNYHQLGGAARI